MHTCLSPSLTSECKPWHLVGHEYIAWFGITTTQSIQSYFCPCNVIFVFDFLRPSDCFRFMQCYHRVSFSTHIRFPCRSVPTPVPPPPPILTTAYMLNRRLIASTDLHTLSNFCGVVAVFYFMFLLYLLFSLGCARWRWSR